MNSSDCVTRTGVVEQVEGNNLRVRINVMSACAGCHAEGCHTKSDEQPRIIDINDASGTYHIGDMVRVSMLQGQANYAVLLAYIVPIIVVLSCMILTFALTKNDLITVAVSVAVASIYYFVLYGFRKKLNNVFSFTVSKL